MRSTTEPATLTSWLVLAVIVLAGCQAGPPPEPTYTPDDTRIDALIRDGVRDYLALAQRMQDPRNESMRDIMSGANAHARTQQTLAVVYQPSPCTEEALASYLESMEILEEVTTEFLDWMAGGGVGELDHARTVESGFKAGAALRMLNDSCRDYRTARSPTFV